MTEDIDLAVAPESQSVTSDSRQVLAEWANEQDEWVRAIVGRVLNSGRALLASPRY